MESLTIIPIAALTPSVLNPRKKFDPEALRLRPGRIELWAVERMSRLRQFSGLPSMRASTSGSGPRGRYTEKERQMEESQAKFEGWALVEMMGHQREIGYVTTEYYGGAALFRIDTPEIAEREYTLTRPEYAQDGESSRYCPAGSKVRRPMLPARTRLVSPAALYALNPCTEEAACAAIDKDFPRHLILIEMASAAKHELVPYEGEELKGEEPEDECPEYVVGKE